MFRLAIFMAAGILFSDTFRTEVGAGLLGGVVLVLLFLCMVWRRCEYDTRWMFGAGVSVFMFLVGMVLVENAWREVKVEWPSGKKAYRAVVQEPVREKPRTYQTCVDIEGKNVWLYLAKDSLSASLIPGDELLVYAQMEVPQNRTEAPTFDFARYLYYKGISGTAYVPSGAWKKTEGGPMGNWKMKALRLREWIIGKYRQWGVGTEQLPVLSALTLGYKHELDEETREEYSVAGISHVLALSGMHIGIIWLLLDTLLRPLVRMRLKWLKGITVIGLLWAFAFVVGLEASVVRAVIMCMLMEIGRISGSRPFSLNTLSIAALGMLLYRPFYLFDVGFQLSFIAVASILWLYPLVNGAFRFKNRVGRWTWGVLSVSMAAQLGTAPWVMYYFSIFSVYFLLTNWVAAILVPFIIYGAVLMVLTAWLPGLQSYVVAGVNGMVTLLNEAAGWVSALPYATFSLSTLRPVEIILFYLVLGSWVMFTKKKNRIWLIRSLALCVCLLGVHFFLLLISVKEENLLFLLFKIE